jgi:hypothetical protein
VLLAVTAMPLWASEVPVEWIPPPAWPCTLRDIAGRLPRNTDARDDCPITYAHEGSHFLCRGKPGYHGVYILGGERRWIPTPPLITEQVLAAVPERHRGSIYKTYLRQGQTEYWQAQPLMILDEWCAYTHGGLVRKELNLAIRSETVRHCATFAHYAKALHQLSKGCEGYDPTELTAFCRWNLERCRTIEPDWDTLCDVTFD